MRFLMSATVLVAIVAAPLRAQSTAMHGHTETPSQQSLVDPHLQPTTTNYFTPPIDSPSRLLATRERSSLELLPRPRALSYTVSEELFASSERGRRTLKGALIGGTVGFVIGAIGGTQIGTGCQTATPSKCNARRNMILGVGGLGAGLGVLIGAGIGAIL